MVCLDCLRPALAVLVVAFSASAARVEQSGTNTMQVLDTAVTLGGPTCADDVPGAISRECAARLHLLNTCRADVMCKCEHRYQVLQGDDPACNPAKHLEGRKFDANELRGKGCKCVTPEWVPTHYKIPRFECGHESYFKSIRPELPDFGATIHSWCDSNRVPAEKRVPPFLRGLYWMKNGNPHDLAFCTSLAEWDAETRTAKLSPWTDFVWRKTDSEPVPSFTRKTAPLVYTLKFTNDTFKFAHIWSNFKFVNLLINFPLIEVDATPDGEVVSQKKGDLFERPSKALGIHLNTYWAVRLMDDSGKLNEDWYKLMEKAEHLPNTSFVRYEQHC